MAPMSRDYSVYHNSLSLSLLISRGAIVEERRCRRCLLLPATVHRADMFAKNVSFNNIGNHGRHRDGHGTPLHITV